MGPEADSPILSVREVFVTPWVKLVEKLVRTTPCSAALKFYALELNDYVTIVPETRDGRFVVVRQFRPAVALHTWEFPAGMLDPGEEPKACCVRELREETAFQAEHVRPLGAHYPDTGRLGNRIHSFHATLAPSPIPGVRAELETKLITEQELRALIRSGEFSHLLHIAAFLLSREA